MSRLFPNKYSGKNERAKHDQYPTPLKPVHAMCNEVRKTIDKRHNLTVLDPCAGDGVWGLTWKNMYGVKKLYGIDIDDSLEMPRDFDGWQTANFMEAKMANHKFDLIISNPPFNQAEEFLYRSFEVLNDFGTIAFLLPLAFMSSIGRYERIFDVMEIRPYHIVVSSRRIDFTGQGNPHLDVAMFIWTANNWMKYTTMSWVDWEE